VIDDDGHCPHITEPSASAQAIDAFLARTLI
jgi:pimeloyl-ACP methyl ester carboxylesterase